MIDPKNPTIEDLVQQGYRLAAHAHLRPGGRVNYTFVAKHGGTGKVLHGWSGGGDTVDALIDLGRRGDYSKTPSKPATKTTYVGRS